MGSDADSEGEWVSVSDEDGDGDASDAEGSQEGDNKRQKTEAAPLTAQQRAKKLNNIRGRVDARRVLTSDDFALLEKLRAAQAERALDPRSRRKSVLLDSSAALKRKREEDDIEEGAAATAEYSVDASALAPGIRAEKTSKIERIMHVLDGRKDAKKFEHEGHAGGLTNKEKLRKKNFVMVRKGKRAVTHKLRRSTSQVRHAKTLGVSRVRCVYLLCFADADFGIALCCFRERFWAETRGSAEEHKASRSGCSTELYCACWPAPLYIGCGF
jgi:hypothetical protein